MVGKDPIPSDIVALLEDVEGQQQAESAAGQEGGDGRRPTIEEDEQGEILGEAAGLPVVAEEETSPSYVTPWEGFCRTRTRYMTNSHRDNMVYNLK